MSEFTLEASVRRADRRLGRGTRRADLGRSRLPPAVDAELERLLSSIDRPQMTAVHRELASFCRRNGLRVPSRSTIYNALERIAPPSFHKDALPEFVRRTLHNVGGGPIPGDRIAFAAFNYGDTRALSWAAGLPWLCLHRADGLGGWRPKSHALLRAVLFARGIRAEPSPRPA